MADAATWRVARTAVDVPVALIGSPTLHAPAAHVVLPGPSWLAARDELVCTLAAFRAANGFGRAIAAPQVGHSLCMIAFDLGTGPTVLLNPALRPLPEAGSLTLWDDCFSFPDMLVRVRRWRSVQLDAVECDGSPCSLVITDPGLAELLQHEVDHLHGVTSFQHAVVDHADSDQPPAAAAPTPAETAVVHRKEYAARRAHFDALVGYTIVPTIPPRHDAVRTDGGGGDDGERVLTPFAEVVVRLGLGARR